MLLDFHELDDVLVRDRRLLLSLPVGRIYAHLAHLADYGLAGALGRYGVFGRVHRVILCLLDGNHLDVTCDALTEIIVRPFGVDGAHLG